MDEEVARRRLQQLVAAEAQRRRLAVGELFQVVRPAEQHGVVGVQVLGIQDRIGRAVGVGRAQQVEVDGVVHGRRRRRRLSVRGAAVPLQTATPLFQQRHLHTFVDKFRDINHKITDKES